MYIKEYIQAKIDENIKSVDIANMLGITPAMVSKYKSEGFNPSINVAKRVYKLDKIVLYPYSEEAIKQEIENEYK